MKFEKLIDYLKKDFCCFPWDVITLCYTCQKERDVYYNREWFPNKNLFIKRRLCEKCNLSYETHMGGCKYAPGNHACSGW
tara:strand:+ start:68 stop:307 length:240 start_codon:yes stop_codon:yes gene_type:complete